MYTNRTSPFRAAGLIAGILLTLANVRAADTTSDPLPIFDNYLTLSGTAVGPSGDGTAFQARHWTSKRGAGGIEDFRYSKDLTKEVTLLMDGHSLVGAGDYLAHFNLAKNEVGSVDFGYQRFRTFYDGVGGFFPINGQFFALPDQNLSVDRSKFWVDATIALPGKPVFHLRYTNELRNGTKDSTIWGDSDLTGIPIYSLGSLNPISANRKFVPAYTQLDEHHQSIEGSLTHTIGNTTIQFLVTGDRVDNDDIRFMNRFPGELRPYPAIPSNPVTLVPATQANNFIRGFDRQGIKTDTLNFTGRIETKVNDKLTAYIKGSYLHANSNISGDREMIAGIATSLGELDLVSGYTLGGRPPYSYQSIDGTIKVDGYLGSAGVEFTPTSDLFLSAAVKREDFSTSANNPVNYTNQLVATQTGAITNLPFYAPNSSEIKVKSWTPELNIRYTGIKNVSLFASAYYRHAPGIQDASNTGISPSGSTIIPAVLGDNFATKENHANYTLGANWNPAAFATLRVEVFSKNNQTGFFTADGSRNILNTDLQGAKLTAMVKPLPTLSFTTRYVVQHGTMHVTDDVSDNYQSGDHRSYTIGGTVDWTPVRQFYLQGNVDVVFDTIVTSYPRAGGTANNVLHNANNNYWTANTVAGFVLSKATDAQLISTYYRADNYQPALAGSTMPYGAGAKESTVNLGLKHKFSNRLVGFAKVGYFDSKNDTTGGNTNFKGPLAYFSLTYAL